MLDDAGEHAWHVSMAEAVYKSLPGTGLDSGIGRRPGDDGQGMSDPTWQPRLIAEHGNAAELVLSRAALVAGKLADPQRALADLRSFLQLSADVRDTVARLQADPTALDLLMRLGSVSRYGLDIALRNPEQFWQMVRERQFRQLWGRRLLASQLRAELIAGLPFDQQCACLARFKHRHFLRIIAGDISGDLGFDGLVGELSDVVDVIAESALELAAQVVIARHPELATRQSQGFGMVVLAMGKLGARELNYSSDIDLIFIYRMQADQQGAEAGTYWHECYQRLGQEIIRMLETPGGGAHLFRVDMRLRPEGDKGELALSLRETVDYYYSVGRPWERQAMIKARPIAGDFSLGERFIEELRPWVFPKDQEWETLEEARSMRRRIEERAQEDNIKTGAGGIRDIEFLAQFFQLSFGGRIPELRERATLPTIRMLKDRGILPRHHAGLLEQHYCFLRMIEHRLQMWEDRQEHELPRAAAARRLLAARCGFSGPDGLAQFDAVQLSVRAQVRSIVARHFLDTTPEQDAMLALVVQGQADERLAGKYLAPLGFHDLRRACANLRRLSDEPFFLLARSRTERSLVQILPVLLQLLSQAPDPDQALENLVRIVSAVGGRSTFFALLNANRQLLNLFADIAGWSNFLVSLFQDFPGLPDEVIDQLNRAPKHPSVLHPEARSLIHGITAIAEPLAFMKARETADIAIRDLDGLAQSEVGQRLSGLASAILSAVLQRVVAERARQWGIPQVAGRPTRFAVLGLGKLGSHELTYASDMDVIFVCDPGGICPRATQHDGEEFWTRVAQSLMAALGENRIYEIDPRLRPWGNQGPLVANLQALADYWSQPRDVWERMAMLRISILSGDPRLGEQALSLIRGAAFSQPLPGDAAHQVRSMRSRLEESVAGRDHVKRGWGGYVDHEFIAEYCCLGLPPGAMPIGIPIEDMLRQLGKLGRLPEEAPTSMISGLRVLRFAEARMRLSAGNAVSSLPTEPEPRARMARRCSYPDLGAFDLALHLARENARRWFSRLIV
jgi:glutamate-ammonia-ligase adenylyltransferase